jgi:hypothetical protein
LNALNNFVQPEDDLPLDNTDCIPVDPDMIRDVAVISLARRFNHLLDQFVESEDDV